MNRPDPVRKEFKRFQFVLVERGKIAGIKSKAKRCKFKKPGTPFRVFPNLLLSEMQIDGPLQCIVSDMTAFYVKGIYYELTL